MALTINTNNILINDHKQYQIEIYPDYNKAFHDSVALNFSFSLDTNLTKEEATIIKKEIIILEQLFSSSTFKKLFITNNELGKENTFNETLELLTRLKEEMKHYAPTSLFDNLYTVNYEYDVSINMKPNKDFPGLSILFLKQNEDTILFNQDSVVDTYKKLTSAIADKKNELASCKDSDFVNSIIEPLAKNLKTFETKNATKIKAIKNNHLVFDSYLKSIGLDKSYYHSKDSLVNNKKLKLKM